MDYEPEELLSVVQMLTERYTGKDSTSVTYEKAAQFMEAAIYCISQHEESSMWEDNTMPRNITERPDIRLAYESGYQRVLDKTRNAMALYESILQDVDSYGNLAYHDTVIKGLPSFFVYYDARFQPQNHILTLDYPVLGSAGHMCGIDLIWHYIKCIEAETTFLKAFPRAYVVKLLNGRYGHYADLFINLPSIVTRNILGWMMSGEKFRPEPLEGAALEKVKGRLNAMEKEALESSLKNGLKEFLNHSFEGNHSLYPYFVQDIPDFAAELKNMAAHDCLVL